MMKQPHPNFLVLQHQTDSTFQSTRQPRKTVQFSTCGDTGVNYQNQTENPNCFESFELADEVRKHLTRLRAK